MEKRLLPLIPRHAPFFAGLLLLAFLFSANGLLFGNHAVEEMFNDASRLVEGWQCVADFSSFDHHHTHDTGRHAHGGGDCCDTHSHHSHDFKAGQAPTVRPATASRMRFFETFAYLPEVFLERFVPPQNLA